MEVRFDLTQSKHARRAQGQAFGNFYFEQEPGRQAAVAPADATYACGPKRDFKLTPFLQRPYSRGLLAQ